MINNKIALLVFRLILAVVFIWSGLLKIIDPIGFAQDISNYRILPAVLVLITAFVLPWVELMSGILLFFNKWKKSSAWVITILLVLFLGLISLTMIRGLDVDCGCFGPLHRRADLTLMLTDGILLFLAVNLLYEKSSKKRIPS